MIGERRFDNPERSITPQRRRELAQRWAYLRPYGPSGEPKDDIAEMEPEDVEALIETGDELVKALSDA